MFIIYMAPNRKKLIAKPHFFRSFRKNLKILEFIPEIEPTIYDYTYLQPFAKTQNEYAPEKNPTKFYFFDTINSGILKVVLGTQRKEAEKWLRC